MYYDVRKGHMTGTVLREVRACDCNRAQEAPFYGYTLDNADGYNRRIGGCMSSIE